MFQVNNNYHQETSNTSNETLDSDDNWVKKIWEWADEFKLKNSEVPRDKEALLAMKKLAILEPELDEQHSRDAYRLGYIPDELSNLTNLTSLS